MATSILTQVTNNYKNSTSTDAGYCKMPDGTLIQWGNITMENGTDVATINFPVSFYGNYTISATPAFSSTRTMSFVYSAALTDSIKIHSNINPLTFNQLLKWLAIGRWKA